MSIGVDLRTLLVNNTSIGSRWHQNVVPQSSVVTYGWFARGTTENEDYLDEAAGADPFRQVFDVEIISDDIDAALNVADDVKKLHLTRGSFGAGTVQGLFVTDHADDYIPRGVNSDDGRHVAAMQLEVVGYKG